MIMKERIRWIAIGFGFMVGIQVLASLMLIGLGMMLERSPGIILGPYWAFVLLGLTLAAFFFGGFIIGRVEEKPHVVDAVVAAIATLALSAIVYLILPESSRTQFTGSGWLAEAFGATASAWISALLIVPALGGSALGAYAGYLMTTPVEGMFERFIAMLGLAGAIGGPIAALIISWFILSWYSVVAMLVIILSGIVISYRFFKRGIYEVRDVSITQEHRAEPQG